MQKEDLKDWTVDRLKDEIVNLSEKNFNLEWKIKQFEESEGRLKCENKALKDENTALKQHIKDMEDVCDGNCFSDETDDRDEKISKMQDRIDGDCVRINRLKVTINTLVDMYGSLRNQVGMD